MPASPRTILDLSLPGTRYLVEPGINPTFRSKIDTSRDFRESKASKAAAGGTVNGVSDSESDPLVTMT